MSECIECNGSLSNNDKIEGLPIFLLKKTGADGLCYTCVKNKIKVEIDDYIVKLRTRQTTENLASKYDSARKGMIEGIDYTMEGDIKVLTKWMHLRRGYCCGSGCKQCPNVIWRYVEG